MKLHELMRMQPEDLAGKQHDALKAATLSILANITKMIKTEQYADIPQFLSHSPGGDDMGCDNDYIEFDFGLREDDIGCVVETLEKLKKQIGAGK